MGAGKISQYAAVLKILRPLFCSHSVITFLLYVGQLLILVFIINEISRNKLIIKLRLFTFRH